MLPQTGSWGRHWNLQILILGMGITKCMQEISLALFPSSVLKIKGWSRKSPKALSGLATGPFHEMVFDSF